MERKTHGRAFSACLQSGDRWLADREFRLKSQQRYQKSHTQARDSGIVGCPSKADPTASSERTRAATHSGRARLFGGQASGFGRNQAPKTDRLNQVPFWEFRIGRKSFAPRQMAGILLDFTYLCWANPYAGRRGSVGLWVGDGSRGCSLISVFVLLDPVTSRCAAHPSLPFPTLPSLWAVMVSRLWRRMSPRTTTL